MRDVQNTLTTASLQQAAPAPCRRLRQGAPPARRSQESMRKMQTTGRRAARLGLRVASMMCVQAQGFAAAIAPESPSRD